jgi:hypothetical protein
MRRKEITVVTKHRAVPPGRQLNRYDSPS